tara:strand:+ start:426 stop:635 length:210 start_codon:yes stop_codon:yes gene_type:complete
LEIKGEATGRGGDYVWIVYEENDQCGFGEYAVLTDSAKCLACVDLVADLYCHAILLKISEIKVVPVLRL